jgi:hypothetical protein
MPEKDVEEVFSKHLTNLTISYSNYNSMMGQLIVICGTEYQSVDDMKRAVLEVLRQSLLRK